MFLYSSVFVWICTGRTWQGFVVERLQGGLCEKRLGAAPCRTQEVPASSARDPPKNAAEPMCQVCGTFMRTYLRKGKNATQAEKGGKREGTINRWQT